MKFFYVKTHFPPILCLEKDSSFPGIRVYTTLLYLCIDTYINYTYLMVIPNIELAYKLADSVPVASIYNVATG